MCVFVRVITVCDSNREERETSKWGKGLQRETRKEKGIENEMAYFSRDTVAKVRQVQESCVLSCRLPTLSAKKMSIYTLVLFMLFYLGPFTLL